MSNEATHWAVKAVIGKGLNGNAKVVLWHLADRHNPDFGCFPSQERLAADCELSRSQLNVHLQALEEAGLIRRIRRHDAQTKKRRSTMYLLGFEEAFQRADLHCAVKSDHTASNENPCPETGHGQDGESMSGNPDEPCPEILKSHVRKPDSNSVREPLKEPVVRGDTVEHTDQDFYEFWQTCPRHRDRERTRRLFSEAVDRGVSPAWIISSMKRYRLDNLGNKPMYVAYSDTWLEALRWEDFEAPHATLNTLPDQITPSPDLATFWASKVKAGSYIPPSALKPAMCAEIIGRGLVTEDELKSAGFRL
ncbi:MAG: helix-turn-helix domain-containing protein [Rhodobacteraceae bacterium]|nr:MAG: helix-turn-helix domain-containing protein [Paracoccaceae bacterium]